MNDKEKQKHIDAFKYWCETNEECGVITIPKFVCDNIIKILDNAPTVDITRKIQSELISEVSHNIARQFLEHNEVVPFWLSIGDIRIKEAEDEVGN